MKKRVFLVSLITFLTIVLLAFSLNVVNVAKANVVFSDSFQSGNLNAWTVTYGSLAINSQIINSGNPYSVQNVVVGQNENLYYHSLGAALPNPIDVREYVYLNSTTIPSANGDYYEVGGFSGSAGGNYGSGELIVTNVGGTLYWGIFYRDLTSPSGFSRSISTSNSTLNAVPVTIGAWNCLELRHLTASSIGVGNGEEQFYVNSKLVTDVTNVYNGDRTPANVVIGGSQHVTNANQTWNYYLDDVIVSDNIIGLLQDKLTMITNFGTVSPANGTYAGASTQIITATPPAANPGMRYVWHGWTGTGIGSYTGLGTQSGSSYTASITMSSNITETASWSIQYFLNVISPYGVTNTTTGSGWFDPGTSAYATITPTIVGNPDNVSIPVGNQYVFTVWSGSASGNTSVSNAIIMTGPKTAFANWQVQYYLNVSSAYGTVGGSGWYNPGALAYASISQLLVPGSTGTRYVFASWGGDASGTTSPSNAIIMNSPKTAIVNWLAQYNVTFTQSGVGSDFSGTVLTVNGTAYSAIGFTTWTNASDKYSFSYVSSPLVVAVNGEQYLLTAVSGNSSASSVIVAQPTTVTGSYKAQYYLTVVSMYDSPLPTNGWFDNNTSITEYVSSSSSGYYCSGWIGTGSVLASGGASVTTFTINAPSTITWTWTNIAPSPTPTSPSPAPSPTPSPSPTDVPTPTPSPTLAPTPTQQPIVNPTSTPSPVQSTPTPTLRPTTSPSKSPSPTPHIPEFPTGIIALLTVLLVSTAIFSYIRKSKKVMVRNFQKSL